jgi:ABC-type transport system involved in multi-copper enzyme maturation permease subunit
MFKLIRGEIYRLLHKKSMYIYFGVLAAGYFIVAFIRSGGFNAETLVKDAINFFQFLPALAGGFLFSAIYTDDLNSKNLITLVGYGINKTKIVIAKFILMLLSGAFVFGLMPLYHYVVYAVLGCIGTANQMAMIYAVSLKFLLMTLAFAAISSIIVYGLQRTTFAMVSYILLAFSVIGTLITAVSKMLELNITDHLVSGITDRMLAGIISGVLLPLPIIEYIIYILIVTMFAVIAFHKKEMEF